MDNPNTAEVAKAAANVGGAALGAAKSISHVRSNQVPLVKTNDKLGGRQLSLLDGEMAGGNKPVKLPVRINHQVMKQALEKAVPTKGHPNQLMSTLNDGTRVIFRKDFGEQAHPIGNIFQGKGPINHYNIEIQVPKPNGSIRTIENLHIVPNSSGGFTWWGKDGVTKE